MENLPEVGSREEWALRLKRAEEYRERVILNGMYEISSTGLNEQTAKERNLVEKEIADLKEKLGWKF